MSSPTDRKPGDELHVPDISVPVFLPDGRRLHRVRQSSLGETDICLERSRFEMTGTMPKVENDASNIGTACHAAFELILGGIIEDGTAYSLTAGIEAAMAELEELVRDPNWRWIKFDGMADAQWFVRQVVGLWYERTLPSLKPLRLEHTFGPHTIYEDDERVVQVKGTIDYLDAVLGLVDWKTGSRQHAQWEHDRWAIQPTVYTWAAVKDGLVTPSKTGLVPFHYRVFWRKSKYVVEYQPYTVYRHAGDWAFLQEKALTIAKLTEAAYPSSGPAVLARWPMNDNHALCSEAWCPAWKLCKGAHYAPGWPKPSRPVM